MKTWTKIIAFVFAIGLLAASCSQQTCPAYSQSNTAETNQAAG